MLDGQNFTMIVGDTVSQPFALSDGSDPLNLTGATVKWQMAARATAAPALSKQTGSGITVTDASGGLLTVAIVASDTSALSPGRYYHELQVTDAGGNVSTVARGNVVLEPGLIA